MEKNHYQGLINKYREYLPVTDKTPVITLNEGNTPLMIAAASYNYAIVGVLVNMGADYNIKNKEGKTAIDIASARDDSSALHHMTNPSDLEHYLSY